jgi:hypothetical protein
MAITIGSFMKMMIFIFSLFLTLPSHVFAKAHYHGVVSSFNVGARYSSLSERRGVVFYRDYQIDPVLSASFFDDRLEFLGESIGYRDFIYGNIVRLRSQVLSIRDNPRFPSKNIYKKNMPDRPDTYEWSNSLEIFIPGYDFNSSENHLAEIDLKFAKDVSKHHGNYFEILGKIKIWGHYVQALKQVIEPNFVFSAGIADSAHNHYFYGANDNAHGINNISYGFWLAFPDESDRYFPIVQLMRFQTVGDHKNASFANGRSDGILFSFILAFKTLDSK